LARYLGARMDYSAFGLGLSWLTCLFLGLFLLGDYFRMSFESSVFPAGKSESPDELLQGSEPSPRLLFSALALLTAGAVLTILLGVSGKVTPGLGVVMAGLFLFPASLIIPGLKIKYSGMGEFITSISLVVFPPAFSFLLLYGEFHRFLYLCVFPLFPLHLALVLTLRLRSYPTDYRLSRKTLMVRLGWVRGVFLHNLLILSGFILFGAAMLFGFPARIVGPVFIVLFPAGYLIWIYAGLERGAPVRWPVIIFLALVVFFLPLYLITFTMWVF